MPGFVGLQESYAMSETSVRGISRTRDRALRASLCLALALACVGGSAAGESSRSYLGTPLNPTGGPEATEAAITVLRVDDAVADIKLDGRLDEAVWRRIPAYDHMMVTTPDNDEPAAFRTHTFLFYSERGLYVGAWNEQPPDTLVSRLTGRDVFDTSDAYQIVIDSSGNGLYGYWFRVKLGDSLMDGTLLPERRFMSNWDGPWRAKTQKTEDGWTVEMFLPWVMLNMPATTNGDGERRMAVEFARFLARRNEVWSWPALPSTEPQFISLFQPIALQGVAPKQEVSLFPYVAGGRDIARDEHSSKVGLDVFWRPSSAFFLSAAVNPDFGQVEADNVVVNLSAFETFFPEKRLFFLENQDVFNTGDYGYGTSTTMLHTRRFGTAVGSRRRTPDLGGGTRYKDGQTAKPVDLLLATKAVAQQGRSRYGLLVAAEDDTTLSFADGSGADTAPGRDFGVVRYQLEDTADGGRKAVGWLATVADHPGRRAIAQSVDGHYRTSSGALSIDSQIMTSDVAGERGWGGLLNVIAAPRTGDQHYFHVATYDDALDLNDVGYLQRNGYTHMFYEYWWRRQDYEHIRDTNSWVYVQTDVNTDGQVTGGVLNAHRGWGFNDNTSIDVDLFYDPPRWDDRNSRGHGVFKEPAEWGANAFWGSPRDRKVTASFGVGWRRERMGGHNARANTFVNFTPADRVRLMAGVNYQKGDSWLVWQGETRFTAFASERWSLNLNFGVFFTAEQHLQLQAQWVAVKAFESRRFVIPGPTYLEEVARPAGEAASRFTISDLVLQARYRWQIAPLSDLFIVYNRRGSLPAAEQHGGFASLIGDSFSEPDQEGLLVKLRYRFGL